MTTLTERDLYAEDFHGATARGGSMAVLSSSRVLIDCIGNRTALLSVDGSYQVDHVDELFTTGGFWGCSLVPLTSTKALRIIVDGVSSLRHLDAIVIETTGDVVSSGSNFVVDATTVVKTCALVELDSSTAIAVWHRETGGNDVVQVAKLSVSGTTVSFSDGPDTVVSVAAGGGDFTHQSLALLTSAFVVWTYELGGELWARIITTSNLAVSAATKLADTTGGNVSDLDDYQHDGCVAKLTDTSFIASFARDSGGAFLVAAERSGAAVGTVGTPVEMLSAGNKPAVTALSSTLVMLADQQGGGSSYRKAVTASVSGTVITDQNNEIDVSGGDAPEETNIRTLDSTHAIVQYCSDLVTSEFHDMATISVEGGAVRKVLGMAIGRGAGNKCYVTAWSDAGEIVLEEYTYPGLVLSNSYSLGAATEAQVDARTYWAHPYCIVGDDDILVLYGRMNNPGGLGTVHLAYSVNAGASIATMEDGFGDDHIGALINGALGYLYFVRNISGAYPKLYRAFLAGSSQLLSTIPINGGVNPKSISASWPGNVIVGVDSAQSIMVVYSPEPYAQWYDITGNHGVAAGIKAIEIL